MQWCEARPECNRLDLKSYLAKPMQRLTKYPLLIAAISKKTADPHVQQRLDQIVGYIKSTLGYMIRRIWCCVGGGVKFT